MKAGRWVDLTATVKGTPTLLIQKAKIALTETAEGTPFAAVSVRGEILLEELLEAGTSQTGPGDFNPLHFNPAHFRTTRPVGTQLVKVVKILPFTQTLKATATADVIVPPSILIQLQATATGTPTVNLGRLALLAETVTGIPTTTLPRRNLGLQAALIGTPTVQTDFRAATPFEIFVNIAKRNVDVKTVKRDIKVEIKKRRINVKVKGERD
jgi:hypothetical protein